MKNIKTIIFMGVSGCGKGTQARHLSEDFDFEYISIGDVLRREAKSGSEVGKKIDEIINKKGGLIPDELARGVLLKLLVNKPKDKAIVLDGYPRTLQQVFDLDKILKDLDREGLIVFNLAISDEEAMKRLVNRKTCLSCRRTMPNGNLEKCKFCGGKLIHREDDTPEKIRERLDWAHKDVEPAIEEYRKRGVLVEINSEKSIEEVYEEIKRNSEILKF